MDDYLRTVFTSISRLDAIELERPYFRVEIERSIAKFACINKVETIAKILYQEEAGRLVSYNQVRGRQT